MGTWINSDMIDSYTQLHRQGYAHSVEVWENDLLVGGLYGLAIGKIFNGESMFSIANNASKYGFISLVRLLKKRNFWIIDCQQKTQHLMSMGAETISKEIFWQYLTKNMLEKEERLVFDTK
jgi:leucyl/phenylalanyl-tRNA--protein transferase